MKGIILAVAITLRPRKGRNNNGVLRERNCTSENFYYLPRRFETEAQPLLVASKTCQPAEVLDLILYRAHRLELHSSRRTAEPNLSSSLPSSLLFLHFSYSYSPSSLPQLLFLPFSLAYFLLILLQLILDLKSLYFLSPFPFFDLYLRKFPLLPNSLLPLLQSSTYLRVFSSVHFRPRFGEFKIT